MGHDDGALLRLALEGLPDGIVVADADDRVVAINTRARLMRGDDASVPAVAPLLCSDSAHTDVQRGMEELRKGKSAEFSLLEGDPVTGRVYEHHYASMKEPDGSFAGTVVVSRDVTDRQLEDARQKARVDGLREQVSHLQGVLQERFVDGMITLVNALEARDPYTRGHSTRVAWVAGKVAHRILDNATDAVEIELAARLHDIGKVAVPDRLLDKPSRLTPDEVALMDTHPVVGEDILRPIAELRNVASIIRSHHERWDGDGYPDGLSGERIPLGSRILALADTLDAMTSQRPYRDSLRVADARDEIGKQLGSQFDPVVGRTFLDMIASGEILSEEQLHSEA
jgi:putative nucleotidyltransferase with HDIG domain